MAHSPDDQEWSYPYDTITVLADLASHAIEYRFPLYPEGHENSDIADQAVLVSLRGPDRWGVRYRVWCYTADGKRTHEPIPSERDDEFKNVYRFPLAEAVRIAVEVVVPAERARWDARLGLRTVPVGEEGRP